MDLLNIVDELQTLHDSGTRVPGFRGKVLLDGERLVALGEELRNSVPANVQEASEILSQKDSIINQAYLEAQRIRISGENEASAVTAAAREEHEFKAGESEIVKTATLKAGQVNDEAMSEAQDIVQDAQRNAYRIVNEAEAIARSRREGADNYAREILFSMEEQLSEILGQIRRGIDALRSETEAYQVDTQVPA